MDHLLALLTSLMALSGNQVIDLDCQANQLGRPNHREMAGYRTAVPFENTNQMRNYAILCATLDWDGTKVMPKHPMDPTVLRIFAQQYCSAPATDSEILFLKAYVGVWHTNWEAGPAEESILKRLSIQAPEQARTFADLLLANPKNLPYTQWYHWYLLMSERRKEEAYRYATEHHIDTSIRISSKHPLARQVPMKLDVVWPQLARTDIYTYSFGQKKWGMSIIPKQNKPIYIPNDWTPPSGPRYKRSWQKGPIWQITYARDGDWVVRTATYATLNSHIEGQIEGDQVVETVVEETQEPAGYYTVAPNFVVLTH